MKTAEQIIDIIVHHKLGIENALSNYPFNHKWQIELALLKVLLNKIYSEHQSEKKF